MSDIIVEYKSGLKSLKNFKEFGQFENNIDDFGNFKLIFNQNKTDDGKYYYTNLQLNTLEYNEEKIKDTNFVDFIELETPQVQETRDIDNILQKYDESIAENKILNETVNALVEKYENSDDKQVIDAMRKQIIDLRIQLGQGTAPTDFNTEFPFLPIT